MKRILVLGAGGFIGNHLVNKLKLEKNWVCGIDLKYPKFSSSSADQFILSDLADYSTLSNLSKSNFDEIYQLAADMGGATYIFTGHNDNIIMQTNVQININLLKYIRQTAQSPRVFFSSSACIYPLYNQLDSNNPDCKESSAYPAAPDSEYGWEKLFSERLFLTEARITGLKVRIGRYHNIYGPYGPWNTDRAKSPAAICRKVIQATDSIEVIGNGKQTRSFLYIDDCINATVSLMKSDVDFPVNIGSEEMVSINQLVDLACSFDNKNLNKIYIDGPVGVLGRNSNNTVIRKELGWEPQFTLREGLHKTYLWIYEQHRKSISQI